MPDNGTMETDLGRTLFIYNPVSQNGNGKFVANEAITVLREDFGMELEVRRTTHSGHAEGIAAEAAGFDTVIALGGDGLVHEVVNGLMAIDFADRPRFALIPVGSGNDFANTLGLEAVTKSDPVEAIERILGGHEVTVDIGRCNDMYFAESVSFGLDAAIAIETMERRKRTGRTGTMLYLTSGLDQLMNHFDKYDFSMTLPEGSERERSHVANEREPKVSRKLAKQRQRGSYMQIVETGDGEAATKPDVTVEGQMYLLAVQNGPTYGGGFRICPDASPTDGLLDICIAKSPLNQMKAVLVFLMAKDGHHARFKQIDFYEAPSLRIAFEQEVPAQIDGEEMHGKEFEIEIMPKQLRVIADKRL